MQQKDAKLISETFIGRSIGSYYEPYVVAEISANHGGSLDVLLSTITAAASSGADAIKIQTYQAETLTLNSTHPSFRIEHGRWDGDTLYDLYKRTETPRDWHAAIFGHCRSLNIPCFSTPFTIGDVDFLTQFNPPAYKVASFEITETNLLKHIASKKKPIVLSTGMASEEEIKEALKITCCNPTVLLHCVSEYPARVSDMNVKRIVHFKQKINNLVGLSDHSLSHIPAVCAVAYGACLIEKHFILDRVNTSSEDAEFSITPNELVELKRLTNDAWQATRGSLNFDTPNKKFRRSVYAIKNIRTGEPLTAYNTASIRPNEGLPPSELPDLLASFSAKRDIVAGTPLNWGLLSKR